LEPLRQGWQADLPLQLFGTEEIHGRFQQDAFARQGNIVFDFSYDGGGAGKGGTGTLFVNGEKVGQGRIEVTECCGFSATEGADVGLNTGTLVSPDYTNPFRFNGKIEKVTIDLKDDKATTADKDVIEQERGESHLKRALAN
jgi:hypothetical protein